MVPRTALAADLSDSSERFPGGSGLKAYCSGVRALSVPHKSQMILARGCLYSVGREGLEESQRPSREEGLRARTTADPRLFTLVPVIELTIWEAGLPLAVLPGEAIRPAHVWDGRPCATCGLGSLTVAESVWGHLSCPPLRHVTSELQLLSVISFVLVKQLLFSALLPSTSSCASLPWGPICPSQFVFLTLSEATL